MNNEHMIASGEGLSVDAFKEMSPNELRALVQAGLTEQEALECKPADVDMIIAIAGRLLNSESLDTVDNALDLAKNIRLDARKILGNESNTYTTDVEGQVVARGANPVQAMKNAVGEMKETL